jgi:hypothetical protein
MSDKVHELNEDKGYQVFSNLMDAVFELCEELNYRSDLTNAEAELLDAMDEYVQYELEQEENENINKEL